ncbi:ATP synthase F1 subunit epsilon [Salisaeta longa]|uniref:ATP synthase F1 subunit epsilon n=1 Tax=Salisaeta longa TaxID=503170 RepID=UPI0003B492D6|nr:ATP synthase F1 subunit epsilon [Salisaeta longa]
MADELYVDIVTPDDRAFRGHASGVRAPGVEGSFEVLKNHAPLIAALGVGPLVVRTQDAHEYADMHDDRIVFATTGGFLEVLDNKVTVLADAVELASEIDVERAQAAEKRALDRLQQGSSDDIDRERAEAALERARGRLRVAMGQVGAAR